MEADQSSVNLIDTNPTSINPTDANPTDANPTDVNPTDLIETEATKIFSKWLLYAAKELPITSLNPIHVSGYPGVRGAHHVSDVDVAVYVHMSRLNDTFAAMQKYDGKTCAIKDKRGDGWFSASFANFSNGRTVNARFTSKDDECTRAARHRSNELILGALYPELAARVVKLKLNADGTKNMSTEAAWARVINPGYHISDVYMYMAQSIAVLIDDAEIMKNSTYFFYSKI